MLRSFDNLILGYSHSYTGVDQNYTGLFSLVKCSFVFPFLSSFFFETKNGPEGPRDTALSFVGGTIDYKEDHKDKGKYNQVL
jgi:hypothetical protein